MKRWKPNAWRYDEPKEPGMYMVSIDKSESVYKPANEVAVGYFTGWTWNVLGVYAWMPMPAPAPDAP